VYTPQIPLNTINIPTVSNNIEPLLIDQLNENVIHKHLLNINPRKSVGPDNIHPRVLKELNNVLKTPTTLIYNKSLEICKIPYDWRDANVTPIFKKGSKKKVENYRPVSITSIPCRNLEKCIRDELVSHLENNNLINDSQHGFRRNKSCLTNLLEFFDKVINIYDNREPIDVIYLDFAKAFDKVPHNKLIHKLKSYYIGENLIKWIEDWLKDRRQRVVLDGFKSEWRSVTSGVPQGSVLGPVLFIIYINDIDTGLTCKISKFADDTKLMTSSQRKESIEDLQKDVKKLEFWSEDWGMPFNVDKCSVMHIGNNNTNENYEMFGKVLKKSSEQKDLGVIVTNNLKNTKQCTTACSKANKILGLISRNFSYKTINTIRSLYTALVRPHLEYAVQFWSPHFKKDIAKIESVQRRATKLVPGLRTSTYHERLKKMNLFSMEKRRKRGDMIQVFKIVNRIDKMNIDQLFEFDVNSVTRGHAYKLKKKRFNLDVAKYAFVNRVIDPWNALPEIIVNAKTLECFKRRLDKHYKELNVI
jgi:hypothetical protein